MCFSQIFKMAAKFGKIFLQKVPHVCLYPVKNFVEIKINAFLHVTQKSKMTAKTFLANSDRRLHIPWGKTLSHCF